jgi:hypothetical protein
MSAYFSRLAVLSFALQTSFRGEGAAAGAGVCLFTDPRKRRVPVRVLRKRAKSHSVPTYEESHSVDRGSRILLPADAVAGQPSPSDEQRTRLYVHSALLQQQTALVPKPIEVDPNRIREW